MFDDFPINRGVSQGDPLSPKLSTVVMEEVIKNAYISEGINVDGEYLKNVGLLTMLLFSTKKRPPTKQMEKNAELNSLDSENLKVSLKIHKSKTNHAVSEAILVDKEKKWKSDGI